MGRVIQELSRERALIEQQLSAEPIVVDLEALKPVIEQKLLDLHGTLSGQPEQGRAALLALLGGRRIKVCADPERGFQVEGILELALETEPPGPSQDRATRIGGSGGTLRPGLPACSGAVADPWARGSGRPSRLILASAPEEDANSGQM